MSFKIFERPEIDAMEEPLHKVLLGNCAKYIKKPSIYGKYGEIASKKLQLKIPPDHICWGITDKNYEEGQLVTTPWKNQESFGMLILGMRGSGKSVLLKNILLDQIHSRFGHYVLAVDPKQVDFKSIHKPMRERKLVDMLNTVGMQPMGFRCKRIIPRCLLFAGEKPPADAQPYMISITDFRCLTPQAQMNGLLYLLGLKQASAAGEAMQRVLNMLNNPKMRPEKVKISTNPTKFVYPRDMKPSTELFLSLIVHDINSQDVQRREADEITGIKRRGGSSSQLYFRIKDRIEQFVIGDPNKSNKLKVDVVQELADNGVLVLITNLDLENERNANIYVKLVLNQIIADVVKFRQGTTSQDMNNEITIKSKSRGRIDRPVVVAIDEADILAPNDIKAQSPARATILQLLTKYRYYGFSLFLVTQDPALIYRRAVKQCSYILTPRIQNEDQAALIHERGVPEYLIEELRKLYAGSDKPVEWALLSPDSPQDTLIKFFPLPPGTEMVRENEMAANVSSENEREIEI